MRKSLALLVILAAFAWSSTSYAISVRCLVYKGTIKASKSIFDVTDTDNLVSLKVRGYWAVIIIDTGPDKGKVVDSNAVIYDSQNKYYKIIPDAMSGDPCDPCHVVLYTFDTNDDIGELRFDVIGKGRLTKYSDEADAVKDFVPTRMKGTGLLTSFHFFDEAYTGPITASLALDSRWTRYANMDSYAVSNIVNDIVTELTRKGEWTKKPSLIPIPYP